MSVDVIIEDPRWVALDFETLAVVASDAALTRLGLEASEFEVSILACDDARIAVLNQDFRAKSTPTNVLSWPSDERAADIPGDMPEMPSPGPDNELGDIAIAYDTCSREAAEQGKPVADHVTHLIVHGTLHLLGFDHENEPDAALMEGLETEILGNLGLADPYRE
ncbi:putative rRNA maturation factor [Loktanella ponticola]|uniref:Endoribonuclease YbeY n=1 Tax=Yoonia ponticola TaxID=1524255 RepID=A0A7W9F191_9RHOB|nr:rRNA maturation RNase YbeY [Yoonia ponticola]MBB5723731.1 putative rRNA maturation factor [Yoonia ponticola]